MLAVVVVADIWSEIKLLTIVMVAKFLLPSSSTTLLLPEVFGGEERGW